MSRASAALVLLSSFWPLTTAAASSHFDKGRDAFQQGRYEQALHEMMIVLLKRPSDSQAREYMRLAGEKLIAQERASVGQERSALLKGYEDALNHGRLQAAAWAGWLKQAKASAKDGRWAQSYDDAQRVLNENSAHADAMAAQKKARRGLARALADNDSLLSQKDKLIYKGLFSLADGQKERARTEFSTALALDNVPGELEDDRLNFYLVRAGGTPADIAVAHVKPTSPAAERRKAAVHHTPSATVPAARSATMELGKWAYDQGVLKASAAHYEEAIELFERALSEAPGHAGAAAALLRAKEALQEQMVHRKAEAAELYRVGIMLYGQGKLAEAVDNLRRVVALDPEHGYARQALSHAEQELQEQGR